MQVYSIHSISCSGECIIFLVHCILHLYSSWEISAIEPVVMNDVYVVVNFLSQVIFAFLLFLGMVNVC